MSIGHNDVLHSSKSIFNGLTTLDPLAPSKHLIFSNILIHRCTSSEKMFRMPGKRGCDFLCNYTIRLHFLQIHTLANHLCPILAWVSIKVCVTQRWISCFSQLYSESVLCLPKLVPPLSFPYSYQIVKMCSSLNYWKQINTN